MTKLHRFGASDLGGVSLNQTLAYLDPAVLRPAPYNPRRLSKDARDRLRRGMEQFGVVGGVLARAEDRLLIAGHQRVEIARELGWESIPVILIEGLEDEQAAALNVLLNNQKAQGEWDLPRLTELLSELDAGGWDATMTGFTERELESILTLEWGVPDVDPMKEEVRPSFVTLGPDTWTLLRAVAGHLPGKTDEEVVHHSLQRVLVDYPNEATDRA